MGRYVEDVTDLSDRISGRRNRLFQLADGKLVITDGNKPLLVSGDNGITWEAEKQPWLSRLEEKDSYVVDIAIGKDSTTAVVLGEMDENGEYRQRALVIRADGTEIPVEPPSAESIPYAVGVSDEGRVFISVGKSDDLYEVKEDGSCELYLTVSNGPAKFMQFHGNLLIMDGVSYDTLLVYDIGKEEFVQSDDTLNDFVRDYYNGGNQFNSDDGFEMYFFAGEESVLYLAGARGLHRHVLGGSASRSSTAASVRLAILPIGWKGW